MLRSASDDLALARGLCAQAAAVAREGRPRTDADLWRDTDTVRLAIEAASTHAQGAADSLREAAAVL